MEGTILVASTFDKDRQWHKLFVKLDDISAQLLCFKDMSQADRKWALDVHNADISTPIPGAPSHGITTDTIPYCLCIFTATTVVFVATKDEASKKAWSAALLRSARDGPHEAKFSKEASTDDYHFSARVSENRVANGKAEFKVRCCCRFLNKAYNQKMSTEWELWHRFSHFAALDGALRQALPLEMHPVPLLHRKVFYSVFGNPLDAAFLEERRTALDTYLCKVVEVRTAVDFFHHHANPSLKTFFDFDSHCKQEDMQFTKREVRERSRNKAHHHPHHAHHDHDVTSPPDDATPSPSGDETPVVTKKKKPKKAKEGHKPSNKEEAVRPPQASDDEDEEVHSPKTKVEKPSLPAAPTNLLSQIQAGTTLHKVSSN